MSLSYLSGLEMDYVGINEVQGSRSVSPALKARLMAVNAEKIARKAEATARNLSQMARIAENEYLSDELGKRGSRADRQERREKRAEAQRAKKEARQAVRQARKARAVATRAKRKADRQTARQVRKQTRTAGRQTRRTIRVSRRGGGVPSPGVSFDMEDMPDEDITDISIEDTGSAPAEDYSTADNTPEDTGSDMPDDTGSDMPDDAGSDTGSEDMAGDILGLSELGKGRAKRKEKRKARGGSRLKKAGLAPARGAFAVLLKLNALKIASKIAEGYDKNPDKVKAFASKFGYKWENFAKYVNQGAKSSISGYSEKSLHKLLQSHGVRLVHGYQLAKRSRLSGAELGIVPPAVLTAIATAMPILSALPPFLRSLGVNVPQGLQDVVDKGGKGSGSDKTDTSDSFKLSTPILIGGGILAVLLFTSKNEKS